MLITDLSPQKNNPKRLNVFIDGKFFMGISLQVAVEEKLKVGMVLDDNKFHEIFDRITKEMALDIALNFVSFRPRSRKEIEIHLKSYFSKMKFRGEKMDLKAINFDKLIADVLEKLQKNGPAHPRVFIKLWLRPPPTFKKKGMMLIKRELMQKGVSRELIDEVLSAGSEEKKSDRDVAMQAIEKQLLRWQKLDKRQQKQKIYTHLAARGFTYDTIEFVIDSVFQKEYNGNR